MHPVFSQLMCPSLTLCSGSFCATQLLDPMHLSPLQWSTVDMDEPYVYVEPDTAWIVEMEELSACC